MPRDVRFYLGRVIKLGRIDEAAVEAALVDPVSVRRGTSVYTFTDIVVERDGASTKFIYAKLAKYTPQGSVDVVNPKEHVALPADVPNLLVAASAFIYLPAFSGIAYQHVWNKIARDQFEGAFGDLVTQKHEAFFAKSTIEPISDFRTFVQRVALLNKVYRIKADVRPPNPLFGPAWKSLLDYIKARNLGEVKVDESAADNRGVNTSLPVIAASADRGDLDENRMVEISESTNGGITDAAVLMAADGYGRASVEGERANRKVVVRTSDNQVQFSFEGEPQPTELYEKSKEILARIDEERYLKHQ